MTKKRFWDDPYLTEFTTEVETVSGDTLTLKETIFYAFSGGQEGDAGTIGGFPVAEAKKAGLEITYRLAADHGLAPGDRVVVAIDWERRYKLMRHHFAAELILELVYQALRDIEKIGAHISPDKARLDFFWPENMAPLFPQFAGQAQQIIDRDLEIISAFSDEALERRYWEIKGFARVSCGGTHLRRTGEVGIVSLKRKNIGKGKERIEVYAS